MITQRISAKVKVTSSIVAVAAIFAGTSHVVRSRGPGGNGVLSKIHWDGSAYSVVQTWNDWTEPYTIAFYFRAEGGDWGWCYIDHQSDRWWDCELKPDEKSQTIAVLEGGELRAKFDMARGQFSLYNEGRVGRTVDAPQKWRSPPYRVTRAQ